MGMPGFICRWYFGAHGLKNLTQALALVGIAPCRTTLIGMIEAMDDRKRRKWLDHLRDSVGARRNFHQLPRGQRPL